MQPDGHCSFDVVYSETWRRCGGVVVEEVSFYCFMLIVRGSRVTVMVSIT